VEGPAVARHADDIARNLAHLPDDERAHAIAGHIRSFWDPRMRQQLRQYVIENPAMVKPVVAVAVSELDESR
jgi:formate dehydrogenase subunit delta